MNTGCGKNSMTQLRELIEWTKTKIYRRATVCSGTQHGIDPSSVVISATNISLVHKNEVY